MLLVVQTYSDNSYWSNQRPGGVDFIFSWGLVTSKLLQFMNKLYWVIVSDPFFNPDVFGTLSDSEVSYGRQPMVSELSKVTKH